LRCAGTSAADDRVPRRDHAAFWNGDQSPRRRSEILRAPYDTQRTKELADVSTTEAIFAQERFGVFFNIVDVLDVTTNTAVSEYLQFDCSQPKALQRDIGKHDQRHQRVRRHQRERQRLVCQH
jgi:hypothetical protein